MTVYEQPPTGPASSPSATPSAGGAAQAVADKAPAVAQNAADHAKDVASEATGQAKAVVGQAKDHVQGLIGQARTELADQADGRSQQAAAGLQSLSGQLSALRDGRPQDAGPLAAYLGDAEQRVSSLADRLQTGGAQGAIDDITGFARRRPGLFLAGAVGLGFLVGRVARSGAAVAKEQQDTPDVAERTQLAAVPVDPFLDVPSVLPGGIDRPVGAGQ
jgi:hypothetical protein